MVTDSKEKKFYSHKWETYGNLYDLWIDYYEKNKFKRIDYKGSVISPLFEKFIKTIGLKFVKETEPGVYTFEIKDEALFFLCKIKYGF